MKVYELLELLADVNPGAEVQIAIQPNWPLQFHVAGTATTEDLLQSALDTRDPEPCEEHEDYHCEVCLHLDLTEEHGDTVWLVAGDHPETTPYAPRAVFDAAF